MEQDRPPNEEFSREKSTVSDTGRGIAVGSLVLGILGLICSCLPIAGLPISATSLILGGVAKSRGQDGMATAGVVLAVIGIFLAIVSMIIGLYEETTHHAAYLLNIITVG